MLFGGVNNWLALLFASLIDVDEAWLSASLFANLTICSLGLIFVTTVTIKHYYLDRRFEFRTRGRGILLGICGGGAPPGSPNPHPVSDQNMPFSIPVFRADIYVYKGPNYVIIASVSLLKFSSNDFFLVVSLSLWSIRSWKDKYAYKLSCSFENHTRSQTVMVKLCTRFQTKTAQNPHLLGRHKST